MGSSRAPVPKALKRELRQEAGFGCCLCGLPIIQFHHIVEWAEERHFRASDMMALCPTHHDQATKGALPRAEQRAAKTNPYNKLRGLVEGRLAVKQDYPAADLGSVTVVNEGPILLLDGEAVFGMRVEQCSLLLSITLRNNNDDLLLLIEDNEWLAGDPFAWDIESDWQKLVIRERSGTINLSLDVRQKPIAFTGSFWRNGTHFRVTPDGILVGSDRRPGGISELALVGIALRFSSDGMQIDPSGRGVIISWPNRRERLWKAASAWRSLERNQPHFRS